MSYLVTSAPTVATSLQVPPLALNSTLYPFRPSAAVVAFQKMVAPSAV